MVNVGMLAVILNVCTLLIAVLAERAIERIMTTFAISRLKSTRRAPVVHDSDAWLFNFPRSLIKYYKYPAIFFTLICGFLLIVFEMVSELGVTPSTKCRETPLNGPVIRTGGTRRYVARVNLVAMSSALQQIKFEDGELTELSAGIPKLLRSSVCLKPSCLNHTTSSTSSSSPSFRSSSTSSSSTSSDPKTDRLILANCTSTRGATYPSGTVFIGAHASSGPFFVTATGFNITATATSSIVVRSFTGDGDIIFGGQHCCAFLMYGFNSGPNNQVRVTYLEYAHQEHCKKMYFNLSSTNVDDLPAATYANVVAVRKEEEKGDGIGSGRRDDDRRGRRRIGRKIKMRNENEPSDGDDDDDKNINFTDDDDYDGDDDENVDTGAAHLGRRSSNSRRLKNHGNTYHRRHDDVQLKRRSTTHSSTSSSSKTSTTATSDQQQASFRRRRRLKQPHPRQQQQHTQNHSPVSVNLGLNNHSPTRRHLSFPTRPLQQTTTTTISHSSTYEQPHLERREGSKEPPSFFHPPNGTAASLWQRTRGPVHLHHITCARNAFSMASFRAALQAYRSIQLENVLVPADFNETATEFEHMTTDDIYRAGLSLKLAEADFVEGWYYEYTECGVYRWVWLAPLIIVVVLLITLGAVATWQSLKEPKISVPYNSRTWYEELVNRAQQSHNNAHHHHGNGGVAGGGGDGKVYHRSMGGFLYSFGAPGRRSRMRSGRGSAASTASVPAAASASTSQTGRISAPRRSSSRTKKQKSPQRHASTDDNDKTNNPINHHDNTTTITRSPSTHNNNHRRRTTPPGRQSSSSSARRTPSRTSTVISVGNRPSVSAASANATDTGDQQQQQQQKRGFLLPFVGWRCDEMVMFGDQPDLTIDFCFGGKKRGGYVKSESFVVKRADASVVVQQEEEQQQEYDDDVDYFDDDDENINEAIRNAGLNTIINVDDDDLQSNDRRQQQHADDDDDEDEDDENVDDDDDDNKRGDGSAWKNGNNGGLKQRKKKRKKKKRKRKGKQLGAFGNAYNDDDDEQTEEERSRHVEIDLNMNMESSPVSQTGTPQPQVGAPSCSSRTQMVAASSSSSSKMMRGSSSHHHHDGRMTMMQQMSNDDDERRRIRYGMAESEVDIV